MSSRSEGGPAAEGHPAGGQTVGGPVVGGRGVRSTEFLALVLLAAVVVADGTAFVDIEANTMTTLIAAVVAYIGQRGYVKGKSAPKTEVQVVRMREEGGGT